MNPANRDDLVKEFAAGYVYDLFDRYGHRMDVLEFLDDHIDGSKEYLDEVAEEVTNILNYLEGKLDTYY